MHNRWLVGGILLVLGVSGCSTAPPQRSAGVLPPGTATVSLEAGAATKIDAVDCSTMRDSLTHIAIGTPTKGVDTYLATTGGLTASSVSFNDLDGFTGSYWSDVQGKAQVRVQNDGYLIDGVAHGYDETHPSAAIDKSFQIKVFC